MFCLIEILFIFASLKLKIMLPTYCPSCQTQLKVKKLICEHCQTEVNGSYELPMLALLPPEDQKFILSFVKSSGSLKEMALQMSLSYPTVRNLLNDIIERIETREKTE